MSTGKQTVWSKAVSVPVGGISLETLRGSFALRKKVHERVYVRGIKVTWYNGHRLLFCVPWLIINTLVSQLLVCVALSYWFSTGMDLNFIRFTQIPAPNSNQTHDMECPTNGVLELILKRKPLSKSFRCKQQERV